MRSKTQKTLNYFNKFLSCQFHRYYAITEEIEINLIISINPIFYITPKFHFFKVGG